MTNTYDTYEGPYIRPCAAFPDGWEFDEKFIELLIKQGLIVQDTWSENHHPTMDFAAVYSDENMETVADRIIEITE